MRKQYAINTLNRIKEIQERQRQVHAIGIDLSEFLDPIFNPLEESIAIMYAKDEKSFETALGWVQWWLYEGVEKRIWIKEEEIDVTKAEDFVGFLENEYNH